MRLGASRQNVPQLRHAARAPRAPRCLRRPGKRVRPAGRRRGLDAHGGGLPGAVSHGRAGALPPGPAPATAARRAVRRRGPRGPAPRGAVSAGGRALRGPGRRRVRRARYGAARGARAVLPALARGDREPAAAGAVPAPLPAAGRRRGVPAGAARAAPAGPLPARRVRRAPRDELLARRAGDLGAPRRGRRSGDRPVPAPVRAPELALRELARARHRAR
ncbi:hypothetical protein [Saltwater crocodilepox virus]|nr:hypothetical protein [Saltwater crocodilepox virus]QGT47375.1 ORF074 [Saltwater crocodilepox virus]QGT49296.1 ORF072 [Saltwater crocodilepox virus]